MKHLLLGLLIVALVSITACLGHRNSGSRSSAVNAGDSYSGNFGGDTGDGGNRGSQGSNGGNVETVASPVGKGSPIAEGSPVAECTLKSGKKVAAGTEVGTEDRYNTKFCVAGKVCKKTFKTYCLENGQVGLKDDPGKFTYLTEPLNLPEGSAVIVLPKDKNVIQLYSCDQYVYAVRNEYANIPGLEGGQRINRLSELKIGGNLAFHDVSITKLNGIEQKYLLDGLTCIDNKFLAGTARLLQQGTDGAFWVNEWIFVKELGSNNTKFYAPIQKTVDEDTPKEEWMFPHFRGLSASSYIENTNTVVTDIFKYWKINDNEYKLLAVDNDYKVAVYNLKVNGNSPTKLDIDRNNNLPIILDLKNGGVSKDYYGPTFAAAGSDRYIAIKKKSVLQPVIYNFAAGSSLTSAHDLMLGSVTAGPNVDANVLTTGGKVYLIFRDVPKRKITKVIDLTTASPSPVTNSIPNQQYQTIRDNFIYAGGKYIFRNSVDQLASLVSKDGSLVVETTVVSSDLPANQQYLLKTELLSFVQKINHGEKSLLATSTNDSNYIVKVSSVGEDGIPVVFYFSTWAKLQQFANSIH